MSSFLSESHVAIQAVGWTLLHFLWQGARGGLIYAALRPWLPSGRGRYGAALVALALLVLLPAFTLWQLLASASASVVLPAVAAVAAPGANAARRAPVVVRAGGNADPGGLVASGHPVAGERGPGFPGRPDRTDPGARTGACAALGLCREPGPGDAGDRAVLSPRGALDFA